MEYLKLNNDVKMPVEGLGTFLMSPAEAEVASLAALEAGYEHIDTANAYMNESRRLLMRCMVRFERRCRWVACNAVFCAREVCLWAGVLLRCRPLHSRVHKLAECSA